MGVTIHYRGTLSNTSQIYPLMEELEDIAKTMDWKYHILDDDDSLVQKLADILKKLNPPE